MRVLTTTRQGGQGPVKRIFGFLMMQRKKTKACSYCGADVVKRSVVQGKPIRLCQECLTAFRRLRRSAPWTLTHAVLRAEAERRKVWGSHAQ
jgi:ribosomal protein L37AE/L43A